MQRFTRLYTELDESNRTTEKVAALERYFTEAPPEDAAWALWFLTGNRIPRGVNSTQLRQWIAEETGYPLWIVEECYDTVGDLSETMALLLPEKEEGTLQPLHRLVEEKLRPLKSLHETERKEILASIWRDFNTEQRFVWHKLMLGGFRVGVSRTLVTRALASVSGIPKAEMAHRIMGEWQPTPEDYRRIVSPEPGDSDITRPYPFFLAYPLEVDPAAELGDLQEWQVEWKWDGIRAQIIKRQGKVLVWSRGEELVTDRYPELELVGKALPSGTVLDGEIVAWRDGVLPFSVLQKRIGRKKAGKKLLADAPAAFMAFDLLERGGLDIRGEPLKERRRKLENLIEEIRGVPLILSPLVGEESWEDLAELRKQSRRRRVEGFMIKRRESPYQVGRVKGDWWKWKVDPFTIDAVMIYAQRGHGRRASLYTDYTFGIWKEGDLVPIAKAYSGLTDQEIRRVDNWIRRNTIDRFGPVRVVKPEQVFELAFEGIQRSTRHKSGIAVRFPRMARWRTDKKPEEADSIETMEALLREAEGND